MCVNRSAQLSPTLCDPMDCSPPGSFVRRILQARILEWVAISFSITVLLIASIIFDYNSTSFASFLSSKIFIFASLGPDSSAHSLKDNFILPWKAV